MHMADATLKDARRMKLMNKKESLYNSPFLVFFTNCLVVLSLQFASIVGHFSCPPMKLYIFEGVKVSIFANILYNRVRQCNQLMHMMP